MARGWNNEFYRMQNKIYIDKVRVDRAIEQFTKTDSEKEGEEEPEEDIKLF